MSCCHAVYNENGIVSEFNLVNIEDTTAKIINEAMDHESLSEFDHFFSETYVGDGAGFFDGCEWIQEAKKTKNFDPLEDADFDDGKKTHKETTVYMSDSKGKPYKDAQGNPMKVDETKSDTITLSTADKKIKKQQYYMNQLDVAIKEQQLREAKTNHTLSSKEIALKEEQIKKAKEDLKKAEKENDWLVDDHARKVNIENATLEKLQEEKKKTAKEIEKLEKDLKNYDEDRELRNEKTKAETEKSKAEIEKLKRQGKWDEEDRELDRAKKLNDARIKTPQFLDESKIQKLNTMKPLMMSVDLNVVDKNGSLSRPVSYVIGVKCHTRLIDSSILPEVAAYPLKEMNKQLRKIKWRSGELKFGRDLLWKIKEKKQTASDARDKKRKWYRRLYELSHMSGDGVAAASIKNGKSPWANWWQDKLTGGNNKDVGHGLIPNATIIMSKSDVDTINREKDIDLLSGSKAAKMCKELFLIGMVVIDEDAESVKVLFPDLHNDYDVMSIAAVKKQLAQLDTAGTKTRDIMKLLG